MYDSQLSLLAISNRDIIWTNKASQSNYLYLHGCDIYNNASERERNHREARLRKKEIEREHRKHI